MTRKKSTRITVPIAVEQPNYVLDIQGHGHRPVHAIRPETGSLECRGDLPLPPRGLHTATPVNCTRCLQVRATRERREAETASVEEALRIARTATARNENVRLITAPTVHAIARRNDDGLGPLCRLSMTMHRTWLVTPDPVSCSCCTDLLTGRKTPRPSAAQYLRQKYVDQVALREWRILQQRVG
jgi:hypothetical protein